MSRKFIIAVLVLGISVIAASLAAAAGRTIPKPLPSHPGNIFLAGEEVGVVLPDDGGNTWRVVDYDGKTVREGRGAGRIELGRLPVGYYDVERTGGDATNRRPLSIGVLARLKAPTPETSPVCCDVGMAWSYPEPQMPTAANLCTLAGLNWVRDRFSWGDLEKTPGKLPEKTRYDVSADVQVAAGLKILQVNHSVPPWVWAWSYDQRGRFPPDLRDA